MERAILAGDDVTGVCVMKVEEGLDTGPVYAVRAVPISTDIDARRLCATQLVEVGTELLVATLAGGVAGLPEPRPQVGEATTAEKISKEDLHLRWADDAEVLARVVRLGQAWTTFRGHRLRVLQAVPAGEVDSGDTAPPGTLVGTNVSTGRGLLQLLRVQPDSRSAMSAAEWIRGIHPQESERLGTD